MHATPMKLTIASTAFGLLTALVAGQTPETPRQNPQEPAPLADEAQEALLAERRRVALALEEDEFFKRCDQNGNGWISLREGEETLGLSTSTFRSYDADTDGRISREEFGIRYRLSVVRVGAFKPPVAAPQSVRAPTRNAEQLRNAYDKNGDGGLSAAEMKVLLVDYERQELPAELALEKLDRDGSTRIDGSELDFLARLLTASVSPASADPNAPAVRQTLEELFGGMRDRSRGFQAAPMPPQIDGPVRHFRRLDLDGSGRISTEDLRRLQAPLGLPARAPAVLAALDLDGDGELSPDEFAAAVGAQASGS